MLFDLIFFFFFEFHLNLWHHANSVWISSWDSPGEHCLALYFLIKSPACQIAFFLFLCPQSLPMSDYSLGFLSTEISVHFTLISSLITGGSVFSCPSPRTAHCVTSYMLGLLCSQIDFHFAMSGLQSIWKFWKILALVWSKMVSKTTLWFKKQSEVLTSTTVAVYKSVIFSENPS